MPHFNKIIKLLLINGNYLFKCILKVFKEKFKKSLIIALEKLSKKLKLETFGAYLNLNKPLSNLRKSFLNKYVNL